MFLDTETGEWGIWNTLEEAQKNGLGKEVVKKRLCCEKIVPQMYTIHMTTLCNLKCKYCYANTSSNSHVISQEILERLVQLIRRESEEKEIICVNFHGGEPLLGFTEIKYIVRQLKELSIKIIYNIQTNGTLITDEIASFFKTVFCKPFLNKIAKTFCRLLHLHFVGNCKTSAGSYSASHKPLQSIFNCYNTRYGNGSSEFSSSRACSLK